jgi:hypothetical protein
MGSMSITNTHHPCVLNICKIIKNDIRVLVGLSLTGNESLPCFDRVANNRSLTILFRENFVCFIYSNALIVLIGYINTTGNGYQMLFPALETFASLRTFKLILMFISSKLAFNILVHHRILTPFLFLVLSVLGIIFVAQCYILS